MSRLRGLPYQDLGFAKIDHHRAIRKGFPEVVFGEGKTPEQVASIGETVLGRSDRLLVTRAAPAAFEALAERVPDARYDETARTIVVDRRDGRKKPGVLVVCAGTSDLPVAAEAAPASAEWLRLRCELVASSTSTTVGAGPRLINGIDAGGVDGGL